MGAEIGATTSIFPYDASMSRYLKSTGRDRLLMQPIIIQSILVADSEVINNPEKYYDRLIEINLSTLEPYINGPFTPDAA